ncbi:MAG: thermonuclease family protein [Rickettsiales bacterium]|jgi:endonuclease YncB( thermonuclease family)|nr:thermonuclease family protein [Rickettsiales bacterium]
MKTSIIALIALLTTGTAQALKIKQPKAELPPLPALVDYIIDGDTFWAYVELANGAVIRTKIRFMNNDAPEMSGECERERKLAIASRDRLGEIIPVGGKVRLTDIKDDKYQGRIDAYVLNEDGDVGEQMIKEGHAVPYSGGKRNPWCTKAEIAAENRP